MQKLMERLARLSALIGGLVLTVLMILIVVSVTGRGLNTLGHSSFLPGGLGDALISTGVRPIKGDFELLEAGISFAIFSFLPISQFYGGHATVDIFTRALPPRGDRLLTAFWEIILTLVILLITWRLGAGMMGKVGNGETTFTLQFPIWWAYAGSFVAACVASIVAVYCAFARCHAVITGVSFQPAEGG